jgi:hypothetical protein
MPNSNRQNSRKPDEPSARSQLRAFRKAAREAGCDDNEEQFQDALRKIAKVKPAKESSKNGGDAED